MPLPTLLLPPDQASYAVKDGHEVIATALDGGASRMRSDVVNSSFLLTVQWTCGLTNHNYLKAFYRTNKALPFNVDLMVDSGAMQTYVARFVPDTFGLTGQSGATWISQAQLEVEFNPTYAAGDAAIIAAGPSA